MGRAVVTIVAVTGGGADGYGARSPARGVEGADGDPAEGQAVRAAVVDAAVRFAHAYATPATKQDAHGGRLGQARSGEGPARPAPSGAGSGMAEPGKWPPRAERGIPQLSYGEGPSAHRCSG